MSTPTELCESAILTYLSKSEDTIIEDTYQWSLDRWNDINKSSNDSNTNNNETTTGNTNANNNHMIVVGAVKSLLTEGYVSTEDISTSFYTLSEEAETIQQNGSQEMIVLQTIYNHNADHTVASLNELNAIITNGDITKIGVGNCLKNKWITKQKDGTLLAVQAPTDVIDTVQKQLQTLHNGNYTEDSIDKAVSVFSFSVCILVSSLGFVLVKSKYFFQCFTQLVPLNLSLFFLSFFLSS